jgi:1-acyl-sn-glycerol-3-phosphate acyltransferase
MFGATVYYTLWVLLRLFRRVWWRWSIEGLENLPQRGQGFILAANHINWTDVHILGASLPLSHRPSWIGKVEIFINPLVAWFFRQMKVIPIKRGKRDLAALVAAENALKQGEVLVIFPEGHRSPSAGLQEGHGGAVRLAVRSGRPIVPIAIWGSENGWGGAWRRKPIHIRFGEPYYPAVESTNIPWDRMNELTEELMLRIAALLPEQYWGIYRDRMLEGEVSSSRKKGV